MNTKEDIQEELRIVLETNPVNTDKVIALSNKLARLEPNKIRFSVDAGVIDRLGQELVARQETAVSELVKNAYDADATQVNLIFYDSNAVGGKLEIIDNGVGMNRNQLVNGFMRISSTDKVHNPISGRYKRKRAGQKGIGRFAVQRLGEKLTIITQTKESKRALKLTINWNDYKGDINLNSITNKLEEIEKTKEEGTILIIKQLRDRWTKAAIRRIYRYVSDILQPFPLTKGKRLNSKTKNLKIDKTRGFQVKFFKQDGKKKEIIADNQSMIYDYALATISGYIDEKGQGIYSIESKELKINEIDEIGNDPDDKTKPFDKLSNVQFIAYYFLYGSGYIPKMQENTIKRIVSGIRLYRNGFRVLPYGELGDDWLKLDESVRKRTILPTHHNLNFFGFVEITDNKNAFNETSSREGLVENEAFVQLQNFTYRTLITGIIKIAEVRNVKIIPNQKKNEKGGWDYENLEIRIKDIASTLDKLDEELAKEEGGKKRRETLNKIKKQVENLKKIQKSEQKKYLKEKSMLRVLSSVGLTIAQFIHEIRYYMDNINHDIQDLVTDLQRQKDLLEIALVLQKNFSSLNTYTAYFDDIISKNVIRELKPIELRTVIRPFIKSIKKDAARAGIKVKEPKFNGFFLYSKPMHPSEWASILFNFYTNSKKAINKAKDKGEIFIECGVEENKVYVEFSDNGIGISKEIEEKIFDEFFTTTAASDFDTGISDKGVTGTGLGLKIVKDIVSSYRGAVKVVSPKGNFNTCIRVEIPKATEKELDTYGI